jgi:hypothetical protein
VSPRARESGMSRQSEISVLWVVVMFTMAFADILSFITPGVLKGIMTGSADGLELNQGLILAFALLTEIPIAMIFLSRILGRRANRIANLAACLVTAVYVVGGGSPYLHYIFFATIELASMGLIARLAWTWPEPAEGS